MVSLAHSDPVQDEHEGTCFGFGQAGESRHSQRKDSSHKAQVGQMCRESAGQESKMAQEHP